MMAPNEFWLRLHQLCDTYDAEGLTADERAGIIAAQFQAMPLVAQRQLLSDLLRLVTYGPDLYTLIVAAANESELAAAKVPQKKAAC
jgi:hypothetical protein